MKQRKTKPTAGAVGGLQVSTRALGTALYVHTGAVLHAVRGKRRKYLRRAWKVAKHLPHAHDGAAKGIALGMLVLLLVAATTAKPGAGKLGAG
jgi:uncharacterized iron-regulated membrane protein